MRRVYLSVECPSTGPESPTPHPAGAAHRPLYDWRGRGVGFVEEFGTRRDQTANLQFDSVLMGRLSDQRTNSSFDRWACRLVDEWKPRIRAGITRGRIGGSIAGAASSENSWTSKATVAWVVSTKHGEGCCGGRESRRLAAGRAVPISVISDRRFEGCSFGLGLHGNGRSSSNTAPCRRSALCQCDFSPRISCRSARLGPAGRPFVSSHVD
jgi:hypothetical protein